MTGSYPRCLNWKLPSLKNVFEKSSRLVELPGSACTFYKNGVRMEKAPIDQSILLPVLTSLRAQLVQQALHSTFVGQPGEPRMYVLLQRVSCWLLMVTNVCNTVKNCRLCPRMGTEFKYQRQLNVFICWLFKICCHRQTWTTIKNQNREPIRRSNKGQIQ